MESKDTDLWVVDTIRCVLAVLYGVLQELYTMFLQVQNRARTIPNAQINIHRTIRVLQSFKYTPGRKSTEALASDASAKFASVH